MILKTLNLLACSMFCFVDLYCCSSCDVAEIEAAIKLKFCVSLLRQVRAKTLINMEKIAYLCLVRTLCNILICC